MTKAYIIFKARKELDHYQANTWKLIAGYYDFDKMKSYLMTLNLSLTPSEARVGWIHEYQEVDIVDSPSEVKDANVSELPS